MASRLSVYYYGKDLSVYYDKSLVCVLFQEVTYPYITTSHLSVYYYGKDLSVYYDK